MREFFDNARHPRNKHLLFSQVVRLLYYRLVIPIRRAADNPHVIARGVSMGLLIGMTPTVGIQMYLIAAVWMVCKRLFKWEFSIVLAIAWSWLSNPLSMIPLYYVFFLTGKLMLLDFSGSASFAAFSTQFEQLSLGDDQGPLELFMTFLDQVAQTFGVALLVGWIPYSVIGSVVGYRVAMRVARQHQEKRRAMLARPR